MTGSDALAGEKIGITYYTPVVTEDNTPDGTKKKSFVSATAEPKNKTTMKNRRDSFWNLGGIGMLG